MWSPSICCLLRCFGAYSGEPNAQPGFPAPRQSTARGRQFVPPGQGRLRPNRRSAAYTLAVHRRYQWPPTYRRPTGFLVRKSTAIYSMAMLQQRDNHQPECLVPPPWFFLCLGSSFFGWGGPWRIQSPGRRTQLSGIVAVPLPKSLEQGVSSFFWWGKVPHYREAPASGCRPRAISWGTDLVATGRVREAPARCIAAEGTGIGFNF